ncbi:MAG: extracellular solute-binding protein, partial [Bacillota bacterium]
IGNNKIAFMTGENAWTAMLTFSSLIAAEAGGVELLASHQIDKLTDFSDPALLAATEKLQVMLQQYASANTIGAVYADAANAFMSNNAAIIANGSWMVGDFAADAMDKWSNGFDGATVHGAAFPGNIAVSGTSGSYGWWIPATATDAQKECASAFIAFILSPEELETYMLAEGGTAPLLTPSAEFLAKRAQENPLLDEYVGAVNADTILIPAFSDCIPTSVANTGFGSLLPKLIDGSLTPAEFLDQLTTMAKEAMED